MSKHHFVLLIFGAFTIVYAYFYFTQSVSLYPYFIGLLLFFFTVAYGSFNIRSNYHINGFHSFLTDRKEVAITFDDGPSEFTLTCLDLLEKHQQKASFFVIGKNMNEHPEIVKKILAKGHDLGNHTYNHSKNTGFKSTEEIVQEIIQTDELIKELTGKENTLFRPPFGVTNPKIRRAVKKTGHQIIGWNVRSLDGVDSNVDKVYERIVKKVKPGSIILLHDTSLSSVQVLERLLIYLDEKGYKSRTINEILN